MSTTHGKAKEGQTPETAAGTHAALAVVQPAQTGPNDGQDEFHGQGGLFQVINGKRQRVAEQPVTTKE